MGLTDEELQEKIAKGRPYAFNMGHGKTIPLKDYKEAGETLMERDMPEVLHDRQTKVLFVPDSNLPKMPHIVDLKEFEKRKDRLTEEELAFLEMRRGREDITNNQ